MAGQRRQALRQFYDREPDRNLLPTLRNANVPPQLFLEVMNTLFVSPIYANYGRMIAAEKFEPAGLL